MVTFLRIKLKKKKEKGNNKNIPKAVSKEIGENRYSRVSLETTEQLFS